MRALVVGGGIGGLSATIALRARGIDVDLVELNPKWDVYGVGIIQPANAIRALDELGLAEAAVAAGTAMSYSRFHTADGQPLADIPFVGLLGPKYPPMNGITRPRLHAIFQEAVRNSGASITLGETVSEVGLDGAVTFTDGRSAAYDLVVAADGINSHVRRLVFGGPEPEYTGQVCWRYNVPRPPHVDGLWMFAGVDGKAGLVPLAPDLMYVLLIERWPEDELRLPEERLDEILRDRLGRFGGEIGRIRDEDIVDAARVVYRPVEAVLAPRPWHRGRVVLIGDAAHATSPHVGQGAAMAIEDAVVLADEVASKPVDEALAGFEARRYDRCAEISRISRQIGRWEVENAHDADFVGLTKRSVELTAEPI